MSIDSYSDETSRSLSVEIPGSSSVESSLSPSPTGILSPSTSNTASTSSLPATKVGVTFAPLPDLAPRKRRSAAPLGMAARSQLVKRRRNYPNPIQHNPMWTDEELEEQRQISMAEGRRRHYQHHYIDEEEDGDDPFAALGRLVKVAGKTIWRKVSNKNLPQHFKETSGDVGAGGNEKAAAMSGKRDENGIPTTAGKEVAPLPSGAEERPVLATITSNGNGEDVSGSTEDVSGSKDDDERHFASVSQTETIREGHAKYAWITDELDEANGLTPTQVGHPLTH